MDYIHWAQEQLYVTCFYEDDNKSSGPETRDEFSEIPLRNKVSASRRNLGITRIRAQNLPPVISQSIHTRYLKHYTQLDISHSIHSSISRTPDAARYLVQYTQLDISNSIRSSISRTVYTARYLELYTQLDILNSMHSSIPRTVCTVRYLEQYTQLDISKSIQSSMSRTVCSSIFRTVYTAQNPEHSSPMPIYPAHIYRLAD